MKTIWIRLGAVMFLIGSIVTGVGHYLGKTKEPLTGVALRNATAQTHAPYSTLKVGDKITFDKIEKEHLGRACSVFFKGGRPTSIMAVGPPDPEGMVQQLDNVRVVNGELYAIGKGHIEIAWLYDETGRGGSRHHNILADDIDYIIVKKENG